MFDEKICGYYYYYYYILLHWNKFSTTTEKFIFNSLFSFCISCFSKLKSYKKIAIEIIKVLKLKIVLK